MDDRLYSRFVTATMPTVLALPNPVVKRTIKVISERSPAANFLPHLGMTVEEFSLGYLPRYDESDAANPTFPRRPQPKPS